MNKVLLKLIFTFYVLVLTLSCSSSEGGGGTVIPDPPAPDPKLTIAGASTTEGNSLSFELRLDMTAENDIDVKYDIVGKTAEPNVDFEMGTGSLTITSGQRGGFILINTIDDDENEVIENIVINVLEASNAEISIGSAKGVILDNDDISVDNENCYATSNRHFGYNLVWDEDFSDGIDPESFSFEIGDGCPNLCGWGNNELQNYSDSDVNAFIRDGSLVIRAQRDPINGLTSARMITKGKKEFQYGRIDIRAKLVEGQGLWPAIWMLGTNIDEVGWPNCGEIDIMELVGHEPNIVHGTAHWGPPGAGNSTMKGASETISKKYSEEFHVFTLLWEENSLNWYMDEILFHTLTPANVTNTAYPFNESFFFIFNIAIGGNWPGFPDDTTVFPQEMEIDYIRVFQEK